MYYIVTCNIVLSLLVLLVLSYFHCLFLFCLNIFVHFYCSSINKLTLLNTFQFVQE